MSARSVSFISPQNKNSQEAFIVGFSIAAVGILIFAFSDFGLLLLFLGGFIIICCVNAILNG